jgi:hypothetical protein
MLPQRPCKLLPLTDEEFMDMVNDRPSYMQ